MNEIGVAGKKVEEVAGKSEVNQVPAKVEEKVVDGRGPKHQAIECRTMPPRIVIRSLANGQGNFIFL
jgi:hypothetical protein